MGLRDRLQHAWNAFANARSPTAGYRSGYYTRPDRQRYSNGNERSIVTSIFNRIANDASQVDLRHVYVDENGRYQKDVEKSELNYRFSLEANIDQTGRAFMLDVIQSMFDEGVVAVLPVETDINPETGSFDIYSWRCCKIIEWYPQHVKLRGYDDRTGKYCDTIVPKSMVAIIENPFYAIMNEPNSTLKRLIHKLNLLDAIDEQSGAGKIDLIVQLPYTVKNPTKLAEAEQRRNDIEMQLAGSKYGIAYIDAAEHVTQLNRAVDNNLMGQITYLMDTLYGQLGITAEILNGTADDVVMQNYYTRTVEPVISAIVDEYKRKFLTKNARTRGQTIMFFRNPFKLVPVDKIAEMADKFTRNEILSPNEFRSIIGYRPSSDPAADELRNRNINQSDMQKTDVGGPPKTDDANQNESDDSKSETA